jgi:biotin operon repressor
MTVLEALNQGEQTRLDLIKLTNKTDREVRKEIERLRKIGVWVISSPKRSGYWITKSAAELEEFLNREHQKQVNIFFTLQKLNADLNRIKGYKTVMVRSHNRKIKL